MALLMVLFSVAVAFLLDKLLGEPKKFHPLVVFGNFASGIERRFNRSESRRWHGVAALLIAVLPLALLGWWIDISLRSYESVWWLFSGIVLYLAIAWQSLLQHAAAVVKPLREGHLGAARHAVAMLVSRDTANLNETQVAKAATESVLENGADAIFSALFWFLVGGVPAVILYRLTNTLDAMWGYKNARFAQFGWAAARLDDVLNFIPARLTALSYALAGNTGESLICWQRQAGAWKSPNAGPVMAAGAGALSVSLGGGASYHGQMENRPPLGPQGEKSETHTSPSAASIEQACRLVNRAIGLWFAALIIWVLLA